MARVCTTLVVRVEVFQLRGALVGWALAVVRERAGVRGVLLAPPLLVVLLGFALAGLALRAEASALVGAALALLGLAGGYAVALRFVSPRDRPASAHEAATAALVLVAAAPSLAHMALFTITSLAEGSDVAVTLTMTATAGVGYVLAGGLLGRGASDRGWRGSGA